MEPYAIIETGGKQYMVKPGDTVEVELIPAEVGGTVEIKKVLAVSDGKTLQVGTPEIKGGRVIAKVSEHKRADKVIVFKKERRKGYERKHGHRQELTALKIESIG